MPTLEVTMENLQTAYSFDHHVEGESRRLDAPHLQVDLIHEAEELSRAEALRANGHNAKTLLKYPNLRVVLIAMRMGATLGEHRTRGHLTLQVLSGEVTFKCSGRDVHLGVGQLFALEEPLPHDVEARQDSVFLLTLTWPPR